MKNNIAIKSFFLSYILLFFLIFSPVKAQDASLLPNAVQQFFDNGGNPLNSGKVYFYDVGTTTFKNVYNSSAATTPYTNPITLNAGGKPPGSSGIYGIGLYRQVVKDKNGNTIWDAVTAPGGGGSTPTSVGDGNLVGTILPWSGLVAPNQYVFAYGQELSRATYPEFYTAVTLQSNVICSSASNTLTGLVDTTQIPVGAPIELPLCVIAGTTVVSKTASTVTLSNPSSVSINSVATFFPYGNGNGSTTFNVPDLRDVVLAGRPNMGGTDRGLLTTTYYGTNPAALGALGGSQTTTLSTSNLPPYTPSGAVSVSIPNSIGVSVLDGGTGGAAVRITPPLVTTVITPNTFSGVPQGGTSTPFSRIQPTLTMNYVIKVSPDTSTSIATGVYSIGGMTGVISCGTGILCTGNIISFNGDVLAQGSTGSLQFKNVNGSFGGSPNAVFISPNNLTLGASGTSFLFDIFGSTSGRVRQTVPAIAGTTNIAWGTNSGTPAVTATTPIVLNSTTGDLTCPTCATSTLNAAALTKTDDTNVTLTLGGSPSTALLNATSLTLGWTGQLGLTRGGTAASLTASNGGIVYSGASALAILAGTTNANRPLISGVSSAPAWAAITYPTTATSGGVPYFSSTSTMSSSNILSANALVIGGGAGAAPSTLGSLGTSTTVLHGNASGAPTFGAVVLSTDVSGNLPNANLATQTANTVLGALTATTPSGLAVPSCSTAASALTWTSGSGFGCNTISGSGTVNSGTANQITYYASTGTSVSGNANATISSGALTLGQAGSIAGSVVLSGSSSGTATIRVPAIAGTTIFQLPATSGISNNVLATDGSGNLSWTAIAGTGTVTSVSAGTGMSFTTITGSGSVAIDKATASNLQAATSNKVLTSDIVYTSETTTTYGTTTAFDFSTFINTAVTLTGNITTMNCSNMKAGQAGTIAYIQDGAGSRTAAFNTGTCSTTLKFAGATFPTLTTSASAVDILSYSCRSSTYCAAALSKGYNP